MKQPLVRPWVVVWSTIFSCIISVGFFLWLRQNTLTSFKIAEFIHTVDQRITDVAYLHLTTDPIIVGEFNRVIDEFDADTVLDTSRYLWTYKDDFLFWDTALPPIIGGIRLVGDCDDYARFATYVLHRKGYETYYVTMVDEDSGHAVAVYADRKNGVVRLADINGESERTLREETSLRTLPIAEIVYNTYPDYDYVAVRTWDSLKVLDYITIDKENKL